MVDNSTVNWRAGTPDWTSVRAGKTGGCGFSTGSFGNSCLTCNDGQARLNGHQFGQAKSAVEGSPYDLRRRLRTSEILTAHKKK